VGAQLSEHGRANALDVRAFGLANGKSISLTDRSVPRDLRETVLHSVCARFSTVLGPGSDWYHEDHIHLDLAERRSNYRICQWNVYDPLPQVAPLLPAERPEEAPPREVAQKSDASRPDAPKADHGKADEPDAAKSDDAAAPESAAETKPQPTKKRRQSRRF
ncbi:MAG TPA: extensin, partial [Bradyrhizobium sp.]|nr:extensin [Bradyrhizobium sp.]